MNEIRVGQSIVSADGKSIGKVRSIQGTYFEVDAPLRPDFWLSFDAVRDPGDDERDIILVFDDENLGDFKRDAPRT